MAQWDLLFDTPEKRVWILDDDEKTVIKTEHFVEPVLERNAQLRAENAGRRWGEGQIAASIPLGLYFDKLVPAIKAGDQAYVKRFLNDSDNRAFRTFEGRV